MLVSAHYSLTWCPRGRILWQELGGEGLGYHKGIGHQIMNAYVTAQSDDLED